MDEAQADQLREIFNIGAGNASSALSDLTGKKVDVEFPEINKQRLSEIAEEIGDPSDTYSITLVNVKVIEENQEKDKLGKLLLVLDKESALKFSEYLEEEVYETGREESNELTHNDESAMKETGNILTGACLAAMTQWVDLELKEGIPSIKTGQLQEKIDQTISEISENTEETLVFNTQFNFEKEITADFLFVFEPEGEKEILSKISA